MVEVVLMASSVDDFHSFEEGELGEHILQQPALVEEQESCGGTIGHHDFVQFVGDAFHRDDLDAFHVACDGVERVGVDIEM